MFSQFVNLNTWSERRLRRFLNSTLKIDSKCPNLKNFWANFFRFSRISQILAEWANIFRLGEFRLNSPNRKIFAHFSYAKLKWVDSHSSEDFSLKQPIFTWKKLFKTISSLISIISVFFLNPRLANNFDV
jgi:hypothetical protein